MSGIATILRTALRKKSISQGFLEHSEWFRGVGVLEQVAIMMSAAIPIGVYVLVPTVAREYAGPSTVISALLVFVIGIISAFHSSELALRYPKSGSLALHSSLTFGNLFGHLAAWLLLLEQILAIVFVSDQWSIHVRYLFGRGLREVELANHTAAMPLNHAMFQQLQLFGGMSIDIDFIAIIGISVVALLSLFGVKVTAIITLMLSTVATLIISSSILVGFFYADINNWKNVNFFTGGPPGLFQGSGILLFALSGIEVLVSIVEESTNPRRSYPYLFPISTVFICIYMFLLSFVLTLILPVNQIPTVVAIPRVYGLVSVPASKYVLSVGSVCGLSGALFVTMLPSARLLFYLSEDEFLCRIFSRTTSDKSVPVFGVLLIANLAILLSLVPISFFTGVLTLLIILRHLASAIIVILLRYQEPIINSIAQEPVSYCHLKPKSYRIHSSSNICSSEGGISFNSSDTGSITSSFIARNIAALNFDHALQSARENADPINEDADESDMPSQLIERVSLLQTGRPAVKTSSAASGANRHVVRSVSHYQNGQIYGNQSSADPSNIPTQVDGFDRQSWVTHHSNNSHHTHNCVHSPCDDYNPNDPDGHLFDRDCMERPYTNEFHARSSILGGESLMSNGNGKIPYIFRQAKISLAFYTAFCFLTAIMCLKCYQFFNQKHWWAIFVLMMLLAGCVGVAIYIITLPQCRMGLAHKAPATPTLGLICIFFLIFAICSSSIWTMAKIAVVLVLGSLNFLLHHLAHKRKAQATRNRSTTEDVTISTERVIMPLT